MQNFEVTFIYFIYLCIYLFVCLFMYVFISIRPAIHVTSDMSKCNIVKHTVLSH